MCDMLTYAYMCFINLGYETCRFMFIKMTTKSKFSPRSSKNGAIGLSYSFQPLHLNFVLYIVLENHT